MNAILDPTVGWTLAGAAVAVVGIGCAWVARNDKVDQLLAEAGYDELVAVVAAVGLLNPDKDVLICDDCRLILTEDNTAPTCGVHDLCLDCDGHYNPCSECRAETHQVYDWAAEGLWVR